MERRKSHRDRTYLSGRIAFNNRCSTLDCLVRNLSQDGARLVFSDAVAVPAEFDIMIRRKGESRRARFAWRTETQAGILFLRSLTRNVAPIESARRITHLEAERDALQRRVAQLSEPA
jgi:hypothetical protein